MTAIKRTERIVANFRGERCNLAGCNIWRVCDHKIKPTGKRGPEIAHEHCRTQ